MQDVDENSRQDVDQNFDEFLKEADDISTKLSGRAWDKDTSKDSSLMYRASQWIRSSVRILRVYDRNIKAAVKRLLESTKELEQQEYRWILAESVMDEKTVAAIRLLADVHAKLQTNGEPGKE